MLFQRLVFFTGFILIAATVFAQGKGYDVLSYQVNLTIDKSHNTIEGSVEMIARTTAKLTSILQHLKALTIDSVIVDNLPAIAMVADTDGMYSVVNFTAIDKAHTFSLKTYYHGTPTDEGGKNAWGGVINNGKMMFAMGVGFSAPYISCTRHWMPCYDEPDDKADNVTLTFITADSDQVASNGLRTKNELLPGGKRLTEWKVVHPIASYLLTFAVGPFVEENISTSIGVPIQCFSYQSDSAKVFAQMSNTIVKAVQFYDSLFGSYPFEKVGYVIAPIGSMEHQTMITLIAQAVDTNSTTPQHELAHMWWGDWVTCKDFNDPWLNEGFATFCESLYLERFKGADAYWKRQHSNIAAAISGGSKIPMYGAPFLTSPRNNYPQAILYSKGAAVLGMLRYIVGDDLFFYSLAKYGESFGYSTASSADLALSFQKTTALDLRYFFKQWVYGIWYPEIAVSWQPNQGSYTVKLSQVQDSTKYQFFRTPIVIEARTKTGFAERATIWMDSVANSTVTIDCSFTPDTIVVDPDGALIKKIIGPVKLGVVEHSSIVYGLKFYPNPVHSKMKLSVSTLPFGNSTTKSSIEKRMHNIVDGNAVLVLYDSNGGRVFSKSLTSPIVNAASTDLVEYQYSFDISLASGTYFAKVLLADNSLVGEGQCIVTR